MGGKYPALFWHAVQMDNIRNSQSYFYEKRFWQRLQTLSFIFVFHWMHLSVFIQHEICFYFKILFSGDFYIILHLHLHTSIRNHVKMPLSIAVHIHGSLARMSVVNTTKCLSRCWKTADLRWITRRAQEHK